MSCFVLFVWVRFMAGGEGEEVTVLAMSGVAAAWRPLWLHLMLVLAVLCLPGANSFVPLAPTTIISRSMASRPLYNHISNQQESQSKRATLRRHLKVRIACLVGKPH